MTSIKENKNEFFCGLLNLNAILEFSVWSFADPILNRFNARCIGKDTFQIWMIFRKIGTEHEVQVFRNTQQEDISPG